MRYACGMVGMLENGRVLDPIRAVLVGESNIVRAGLRALLEKMHVQVVAETAPCPDCLDPVRHAGATLLLFYVQELGAGEALLLVRLRTEFPKLPIIALSHFTNYESVTAALKTGASGYLPLDADPTEFELCLHAVSQGQSYISPQISNQVLSDYRRDRRAPDASRPQPNRRTDRQLEVLRLIVQGRTTQEIARDLRIAVKTVESHRANIMDRLGIHDIPGLVRYAIRTGLIDAG